MSQSIGHGWRREDAEASYIQGTIESHPNFSSIKPNLSASNPGSQSPDIRQFSPTRHNQFQTKSCVANGLIRACENKQVQNIFNQLVLSGVSVGEALRQALITCTPLSRLALYYLTREAMNPSEVSQDQGTIISLGAEVLRSFGVCKETQSPGDVQDQAFWPWDTSQVFTSPSWAAMREASGHKIKGWYRITSTGQDRIADCILALQNNNPVVFGTNVGSNWMNYDGMTPLDTNLGIDDGGHCTVLMGWDTSGYFWDENSWGPYWGLDGFCQLRPEIISSNVSSDFVVIQSGFDPDWSVT